MGAEVAADAKWEIGLAAGVVSYPDYMGSDQQRVLALGVPYVIYRSRYLRLDRGGLRGILLATPRLSLDLGLSLGPPVSSGSNTARQGMPALNLTVEAGPRLNWLLADNRSGRWIARLAWRQAVDIRGHDVGAVAEPGLIWEPAMADSPWSWRFGAGALWASQRYNAHYYAVDPIYATATRPAYQATGGWHSVYADARLRYRFSPYLSASTFVRLRDMSGGVVADSPLVRRKVNWLGVVAVTWSFWQSEARVGEAADAATTVDMNQ
jgi:outer membrane scaffolding protein for murein synthesis (MipA/OmpV family)